MSLVIVFVSLVSFVIPTGAVFAQAPLPEPRPLGREIPEIRAGAADAPATTNPAEDLSGPLTLRQALALALMKTPVLAAFSWEIRARDGSSGIHGFGCVALFDGWET